jgi:hypothetical protein
VDRIVDMAVIVTDRARSALKMLCFDVMLMMRKWLIFK